MRGCRHGIALLLLALLSACAFDDDDPGTFSGPVLQRTALQPGLLARAYADPVMARRTEFMHSDSEVVLRLLKGQSPCPLAGG
jgi:hypothetical protein